jgi:membrane associated rhomboid family serine protease
MWLFPVALCALLGIILNIRFGIRWTWGACLQSVLMLLASLSGFFFLYAPPALVPWISFHQAATFFSWLAWVFFASFIFGQRIVLNRLTADLTMMRIAQAKRKLPVMRMLTWGPPADYWVAMTQALDLYHQRRVEDAEQIVQRWQNDKRIPARARNTLLSFSMLGRILLDDYDAIIQQFELNQASFEKSRAFVPYQLVARAYGYKHRYAESLACIKLAHDSSLRISPNDVDFDFIIFFGLAGAVIQLDRVLEHLTDRRVLPEYSRLFWRGICQAVAGNTRESLRLLLLSKEQTPADMPVAHERLDRWINKQRSIEEGAPSTVQPAEQPLIDEAWRMYVRWQITADALRPARMGPGVATVLAVLIIAYVASNPFDIFGFLVPDTGAKAWLVAVQLAANKAGQLDPHLWSGEWWRLVTYMLLHGNTAHLAMNAGALYLFGKPVEHVYGTGRFLVIFSLAGIISGMVQLVAMPNEPAIGASGAVLGIFGAVIAGIVQLKHVLPSHIRKAELRFMVTVALAQVFFDQAVNSLAAVTDKTQTGARIAAFAHVGGIIAGFILGMILPTRKWQEIAALPAQQSQNVDMDERSG